MRPRHHGLGWAGPVTFAESGPIQVSFPLEEWSTIAAAQAYNYIEPLLEAKLPTMVDAALAKAQPQLIDYGLQQARLDTDRARKEAWVGSIIVLASIWGAAWWIRKKR